MSGLSVKELKKILDAVGMKSNDCFEKADLIKRIGEYKQQKKANKEQASSRGAAADPPPRQSQSQYRPPPPGDYGSSSAEFSYMPKPTHACFKITSVGNSEVGKSCLIKRYCEGRFVKRYISTIGVDYGVKKLTIRDIPISINFFDLSGNEDYKAIRTEFYEDTSGIVMVYDVTNKDSFSSLVQWEEEMRRCGVDMARVKIIVCGNKSDDSGREVNPQQV